MVIKLIPYFSVLFYLYFSVVLGRSTVTLSLKRNETKIAFGSCYGIFGKKGDIFRAVVQNDPGLWVWLGDAAYTDKTRLSFGKIW